MQWAVHVTRVGKMKMPKKFWLQNPKGRDYSDNRLRDRVKPRKTLKQQVTRSRFETNTCQVQVQKVTATPANSVSLKEGCYYFYEF